MRSSEVTSLACTTLSPITRLSQPFNDRFSSVSLLLGKLFFFFLGFFQNSVLITQLCN